MGRDFFPKMNKRAVRLFATPEYANSPSKGYYMAEKNLLSYINI